ncbi:MAG TPA: MOSC domain-containing protein [Candidatus Acidoferrales bacterium]|nr:MOSC domain-containing protein [Candidatus Acidoferrales bacterium]
MKIISLNVGLPRRIFYGDREVMTGIFKSPADGPRMLYRLNVEGDRQADLNVHGGTNKALYAYPSEHYAYWRQQLPEVDFTWGQFGENVTTEGLWEQDVWIGDVYRMGQAVVKVTQPRMPCYKLGIRFGRDDMVKRFLVSGRSGIYFSVVEQGLLGGGDTIEKISTQSDGISIRDVNRAYAHSRDNLELVRRIVDARILPSGLQQDFADELARIDS